MTYKSYLFIFLVSWPYFKMVAQTSLSPIDQLKLDLSRPMADTSRVLMLDQLALKITNNNPIDALKYANEGLVLSKKIGFEKGKSRIFNRLGTIYRRTSNFALSLKMHLEAIQISEKIDDQVGLSKIYNNLGNLYSEQNDFKRAIQNLLISNAIAVKLKNNDLIESSLHNIGQNYEANNQMDSALYYLQKVYDLELNNKDSKIKFTTLEYLGKINAKLKNDSVAMAKFRQCVPEFIKIGDNKLLGETYFDMALVFDKENQKDSTIFYAKKSLQLAQNSQSYEYINYSALLLSKLYEKSDLNKSFNLYKQAVVAKDSIFNMQKYNQMQNVDFQEKVRQQELVDSKKEFETRQKIGVLLGLLATFLVISLIQYRNNKHKQKVNLKLSEQKDAIESQKIVLQNSVEALKTTQKQLVQQEKLASLGELTAGIAHEIQNPLNFVNNFSEVNSEIIKEIQDERAKHVENRDIALENELLDDLAGNQLKILHHGNRASGIVKAMLDHSRNSTGQKTKVDLNQLTDEYLRLSYLGVRGKYKDFNADFELIKDENLPKIEIVSQDIARVILNLINNAFYAVYERKIKLNELDYSPKVIVKTNYFPNQKIDEKLGLIEIKVTDNGAGMNEDIKAKIFQPFFTTKPTGEGTGLGLSLSYEIVTIGHQGILAVESVLGQGATFIIKLPIS
jgi:two-component system, NtrC family, sensor kinase